MNSRKFAKYGRKPTSKGKKSLPKVLSGGILQRIVEETVDVATTTAGGIIGFQYALKPADLILAARLAGLRALHDEIRIDRVRVRLEPQLGANCVSTTAMYIERDPTAAVVGTIQLAASQFESVSGPLNRPLELTWRPQQPSDLEYHLLNPGTVSLGTIYALGGSSAVTASVPAYLIRVTLYATVRGRP